MVLIVAIVTIMSVNHSTVFIVWFAITDEDAQPYPSPLILSLATHDALDTFSLPMQPA